MNSEQKDIELDHWFSTYGLITTERILSKYQIKLPQDLLLSAIKNQYSFYHCILQLPLKNVYNGIVMQQAHDYYVYGQKLYIDYLLSPESASPEDAPGSSTRESLEEERQKLIILGESFHKIELDQNSLIAKTQSKIIQLINQWKTDLEKVLKAINKILKQAGFDVKPSSIRRAMDYALIHCDLKKTSEYGFIESMDNELKLSLSNENKEKMLKALSGFLNLTLQIEDDVNEFKPDTQEMNSMVLSYRSQFFDAILTAIELIKLLPTYKIDVEKDLVNRESLYFDKSIGEL